METHIEQPTPAACQTPPMPIRKGRPPSPAWRVLLYGTPGCGKSTLGAKAPGAFFLDLENGLERVECDATPRPLTALAEVLDWLRWFIKSDYKTVVIDTIDELEKLLGVKVLDDYNKGTSTKARTVGDIPYGRGGELLVMEWRRLIDIFNHVSSCGKNVLLIGHEQIVKFENPTDANYDFYGPNIHKKALPVVMAKLDAVLFARFETFIRDAEDGKGKAVATGKRVLHTLQGASYVAKNRFNLPAELGIDDDLFAKLV